MKIKNLMKIIFYTLTAGITLCFLFFLIIGTWIGYEVTSNCREAQKIYGGDCVNALTNLLKDTNKNFRSRNDAIWVLGQLGDRRALPVLKSYYTGKIPPREPLDKALSQYELKKAVNLTSGGINMTAIFWRYGINF